MKMVTLVFVQIVPEDTCLTSMTKPFKLDSLQPLCLKVHRDNLLGGWMIITFCMLAWTFKRRGLVSRYQQVTVVQTIVPFGFNVG